ncbi:MAG: hypothetical protein HGB12_12835 [Bacteroidetes bacterium]|jgi:hypothetical protein|nr:hypothetical protein [Bacteroidota bacterium]
MSVAIFEFLYELIIGPVANYPDYRNSIFNTVAVMSIVMVIIVCLIFYVGLGRWQPVFCKLHHWIVTIFIVAGLGFYIAYSVACGTLGNYENDAKIIPFGFINAIYSILSFIMFSFLLKRISIFCKRTPI